MANTDPVADTAGVVEQVWRLGREAGHCDVYPVGAVTVGLEGERLAELGAMADSAARVRVFSDDGKCVSDAVLMRRALEYVKAFDGVIAQHAQEPRLTEGAQMNEGELSGRLGLTGWPAVAEEAIIARDVLLAAHVGSRLHVCHVSTAGSVEIVRWAKRKGWNVTAEVTPHHLLLTDDLAATYDPIYKVNPPLRSAADVEALRAGLADGTIDVVATDHAPHPHEDKDCEWAAAAFGMLGLETALSVVQETMVDTGLLDWAGVADRMSSAPARIGRLRRPRPPAARSASRPTWCSSTPTRADVVDRRRAQSLSRNTPYAGRWTLPARCRRHVPARQGPASRREAAPGMNGRMRATPPAVVLASGSCCWPGRHAARAGGDGPDGRATSPRRLLPRATRARPGPGPRASTWARSPRATGSTASSRTGSVLEPAQRSPCMTPGCCSSATGPTPSGFRGPTCWRSAATPAWPARSPRPAVWSCGGWPRLEIDAAGHRRCAAPATPTTPTTAARYRIRDTRRA